jgi:pimeloyl-ACP methyl ester carboxylesterase
MKMLRRRTLGLALGASLLAALLTACAVPGGAPPASSYTPIIFVHGNGDSAALWQTTQWRFESNGWPRERLHAIDVPYPLARADDGKAQPGSTSTAEHMAYLQAEVNKVLQRTGASKVILMANSRGGNAVRNYIANGGGDKRVSHAILGGTPNHGVWAIKGFREGNEFSGTGPFLTALNAPKNAAGDEVTGPVRWLTIRSDSNDKFAQPDGLWIGARGKPTFVTFAGPELKGAKNVIIPRIDHRETAFSPAAFDASWRFITGSAPKTLAIIPEEHITLSGQITGLGLSSTDPASGNYVNNLPVAGARIEVYATDSEAGTRLGAAAYSSVVGADGRWGPLAARAGVAYEFVISAPGYATTHVYRSAFPRSSSIVQLRAERLAEADKAAAGPQGSVVTFTRPRGYFDLERDKLKFDGSATPAGVPAKGAGVSASKLVLKNGGVRTIRAEFNGEKLAGQTWPAAENHLVLLEVTQ